MMTADNGVVTEWQSYLANLAMVKGGGLEKYWTDSEVYRCAGGNQQLATKFVQAIGVFPVGSMIELSSGEIGVVVAHNPVRRLEPKVLVLSNPASAFTTVQMVFRAGANVQMTNRNARILRRLINEGLRLDCNLVIETATARDSHQFACLLGYGASVIYPYLAYASLYHMVETGEIKGKDLPYLAQAYRKGINKGLYKIISKMGIATISSYRGAQLFDEFRAHPGVGRPQPFPVQPAVPRRARPLRGAGSQGRGAYGTGWAGRWDPPCGRLGRLPPWCNWQHRTFWWSRVRVRILAPVPMPRWAWSLTTRVRCQTNRAAGVWKKFFATHYHEPSDDLALPFGSMRLRTKGSHGGQNGLRSIIDRLGTNEFIRLRIGIQPEHPVRDASSFVLENFSKAEFEEVENILDKAADAVRAVIKDGAERAMADFN